jgi:formamidopyrimidine-DNA glycosylase
VPELPEVETVRRTLLPHLRGKRLGALRTSGKRLRSPVDARRLARLTRGKRILDIRRRAKYLLFDLEGGSVLLVHLGMSGSLWVVPAARPRATHDHVVWALPGAKELRFNDPRRFGMVEVLARAHEGEHRALASLGVEPLTDELNGPALFAQTRGLKKPIKNFIMDGNRVVGVGNIYACESLFRAGIHPATPAGHLLLPRIEGLVAAVKETLEDALTQGGTTLRDFSNADGEAGYFAVRLLVYGREGEACPRCTGRIRRVVQAGRSTFFCPRCQRRSATSSG